MQNLRLSSKGQIVLPKNVRDAHGWEAGQEFLLQETSGGVLLVPAHRFPPTRMDDVVGCAGYDGPTRSLEEMQAAIAEGIRQQK